MKKYIVVILIMLFILTGCGKKTTITCVKGQNEFIATYKNDKMIKLVMQEELDSEQEAKSYAGLMYSIMGNSNGFKTKTDGKLLIMTFTGKALQDEYKDLIEDNFKKSFEDDGYKCK